LFGVGGKNSCPMKRAADKKGAFFWGAPSEALGGSSPPELRVGHQTMRLRLALWSEGF